MKNWRRKILCFVGLHKPTVDRVVYVGNVTRAELHCSCGTRFEAFIAGPLELVTIAPTPGEFWTWYDSQKGYLSSPPPLD